MPFLAYALFLIDSRKVLSMRVCQPRPVDLKWSITSGDKRSETNFLVGAFCGPRVLRRTTLPLRMREACAKLARGRLDAVPKLRLRRQIARAAHAFQGGHNLSSLNAQLSRTGTSASEAPRCKEMRVWPLQIVSNSTKVIKITALEIRI